MSKKHSVIFITGLGEEVDKTRWAVSHWRNGGLNPIVHSVGWHDSETKFQPKLERLIEMIDILTEEGDKVSLVGCSAGGSAALNAFFERKNIVYRVINVCGRLRTGTQEGFRSFAKMTKSSPPFAESIKLFESHEKLLSETDRQKVMTVRSLFGDELVPSDTSILIGAYNTTVPTPEHMFSITMALTIFSSPLITFLTKS